MALRQEELTSLSDDVDLERDRALVERCQAGDSGAFGNLYARYHERLLRFCLRRLNDRHEAEDAAQEAFARAWKALPQFAGERRFYPWLTVIAGNICTDMLRRSSRSTPTDEVELTAQPPVGLVGADTSEELVLAAVDGELVNRALNRLSPRHRHVLAMREGSGWTYQQIAEHEGVEIGTIETLLWRARQALKREFAVVSQSKEALAGFLVAGAALFRRTIFRFAHRSASVHSHGRNPGGLRNAVAGVAVTGAAVAAALITPHALLGGPSNSTPLAAAAAASAANPSLPLASPTPSTAVNGSTGAGSTPGSRSSSTPGSNGSQASSGKAGTPGGSARSDSGTGGSGSGGLGGLTGGLSSASDSLGGTVGGVTNSVGSAVSGLGSTVGGAVSGLGSGNLSGTVSGAVGGLSGVVSGLGGVTGGTTGTTGTSSGSGSGTSGSPAQTTTSTTTPGLLGGLTQSVGNTLGGLLGN